MGRLRFLTAGESHGPTLGRHVEGVPAGLAADRGRARGRPRPAPARLRPRRAPGDRARPGRDRRRRPPRPDARLADPAPRSANRDWENWTRVMQVEALSEDEAAELAAAADGGNKRATPVTRVRPGHADLAGALKYGFNDVRNVLERASARETAARVAAGGVARAFLARARRRRLVVHGRGRRGRASIPARATRSREEADASPLRCPDPEAEAAMIARIDEARVERRHGRRRVRGRRPRAADRAGLVRPLGSPARRRARRGGDEHQHRQGRRVRARVRADAAVRVGGPRRHRGPRRGRPLDPPHEQRRRADRRRHERRAARRPRRGQADLDARPAAAVGRPA